MSRVEEIRKAWEVAGPRPDIHKRTKENLRKEWPTLYYAIINLLKEHD